MFPGKGGSLIGEAGCMCRSLVRFWSGGICRTWPSSLSCLCLVRAEAGVWLVHAPMVSFRMWPDQARISRPQNEFISNALSLRAWILVRGHESQWRTEMTRVFYIIVFVHHEMLFLFWRASASFLIVPSALDVRIHWATGWDIGAY